MSLPQVPWWRDSGPLHYQQASHPHHGAVPGEDVREQLGTVAPGDHANSVPAGGPSPLHLPDGRRVLPRGEDVAGGAHRDDARGGALSGGCGAV